MARPTRPPTPPITDHADLAGGEVREILPEFPHALSRAKTPQTITRRQFYQGLAAQGAISQNEAMSAATAEALPGAFTAALAPLVPDQRFAAELVLRVDEVLRRDHPVIEIIRTSLGYSPETFDAFWRQASQWE